MKKRSFWEIFFEDYADAYVKADMDRIECFFSFPLTMINQSGAHIIKHSNELHSLVGEFAAMLKEKRFENFTAKLMDSLEIGEDQSVAVVNYCLYNCDNELFLNFDYLYQLKKEGQTWHIKLASLITVHNDL